MILSVSVVELHLFIFHALIFLNSSCAESRATTLCFFNLIKSWNTYVSYLGKCFHQVLFLLLNILQFLYVNFSKSSF